MSDCCGEVHIINTGGGGGGAGPPGPPGPPGPAGPGGPGVIVLNSAEPIPPGTPAGTIVLRRP